MSIMVEGQMLNDTPLGTSYTQALTRDDFFHPIVSRQVTGPPRAGKSLLVSRGLQCASGVSDFLWKRIWPVRGPFGRTAVPDQRRAVSRLKAAPARVLSRLLQDSEEMGKLQSAFSTVVPMQQTYATNNYVVFSLTFNMTFCFQANLLYQLGSPSDSLEKHLYCLPLFFHAGLL